MTNQKSLDKNKSSEGKGIKINCPYCGKEAKWVSNTLEDEASTKS